jgi:hypothetical protein
VYREIVCVVVCLLLSASYLSVSVILPCAVTDHCGCLMGDGESALLPNDWRLPCVESGLACVVNSKQETTFVIDKTRRVVSEISMGSLCYEQRLSMAMAEL